MNSIYRTALAASAGVAIFAIASTGAQAEAAAMTLTQQIVGSWSLVSAETTNADGSTSLPFGANPKGGVTLGGNGYFVALSISSTLPRIASNNRMTETARETKAITQGSDASFGTYTVNDAAKTLVEHVDTSTYPNSNGRDETRVINLVSAAEMSVTSRAPGAGTTVLTYRRTL